MGHHLDEVFGNGYYALGFDFGAGSFQAMAHPKTSDKSGINEFSVDTLSYDVLDESTKDDIFSRERLAEPPLHDVLQGLGDDLVFLDFEPILADDPLCEWLTQIHLCYWIGAVFGEDDLEYTHLPIRITNEFDGVFFVRETSRARYIEPE